jgi:hypothetical protein
VGKIACIVVQECQDEETPVVEIKYAQIRAIRPYVSMITGRTFLHLNFSRMGIEQAIDITLPN